MKKKKFNFLFWQIHVLLVEGEAGSHVGLENLCDRDDLGCSPDVQAQVHPDNDDGDDDGDDVDGNRLL